MKLFRTEDGKNYAFPFLLVTILFFLWGFAHSMLDVLNKHFQDALSLTKLQSAFVQNVAYGAYFLMGFPAGMLAKRFGYKGGIIVGLSLFAIGAFWFVPAVHINHFWAFLLGLLVLFCGLTCLEASANPYTTVLGSPHSAATRINLAQTMNSLGWVGGPLLGSLFIFKNESGENPFVAFLPTLQKVFFGTGATVAVPPEASVGNSVLIPPYVILGVVVLLVLVLFICTKLPEVKAGEGHSMEAAGHGGAFSHRPLPQQRHFVLGVIAQLLYVGAQTGVGSFFVNYTTAISSLGISNQQAGLLLGFGCMGSFLIGRFVGTAFTRFVSPKFLLGLFGAIDTALMAIAVTRQDRFGVIALIASYLFMSIMFPSIFALGIYGLGEKTKTASSILVMTVVGGAFVPSLMAAVGAKNMGIGFIIPLICFAFIAFYGFVGSHPKRA